MARLSQPNVHKLLVRHRPGWLTLAAVLLLAGCNVLPTESRAAADVRADYFRSLGWSCQPAAIGATAPAGTEFECRGKASGVDLVVGISVDAQGRMFVAAAIPQELSRKSAIDAWSIILPMPGLETVHRDVAAGLQEWAAGGAAMLTVTRGLAWVSTGEAGLWTLNIEPDRAASLGTNARRTVLATSGLTPGPLRRSFSAQD